MRALFILAVLSFVGFEAHADEDNPDPVYLSYLTEGWESPPKGMVAQVTETSPSGGFQSETGHWYVECPIGWEFVSFTGDIPKDEAGLPQLLWNGEFAWAIDIEESFSGDSCSDETLDEPSS